MTDMANLKKDVNCIKSISPKTLQESNFPAEQILLILYIHICGNILRRFHFNKILQL